MSYALPGTLWRRALSYSRRWHGLLRAPLPREPAVSAAGSQRGASLMLQAPRQCASLARDEGWSPSASVEGLTQWQGLGTLGWAGRRLEDPAWGLVHLLNAVPLSLPES